MTQPSIGVIERYLTCRAAHDWDGVAATLADDGLVREGTWCDVIEGRDEYVAGCRRCHELTIAEHHDPLARLFPHLAS